MTRRQDLLVDGEGLESEAPAFDVGGRSAGGHGVDSGLDLAALRASPLERRTGDLVPVLLEAVDAARAAGEPQGVLVDLRASTTMSAGTVITGARVSPGDPACRYFS